MQSLRPLLPLLFLCLSSTPAWAQTDPTSDDFGYEIDQSFAYSWTDISTTGTAHTATSATTQAHWLEVGLPFAFPFYGNSYDSIFFSVNGGLRFSVPDPQGAGHYWGFEPPSASGQAADIAVLAEERLGTNQLPNEGTVYTYSDTSNNTFIISWVEVPSRCEQNGPYWNQNCAPDRVGENGQSFQAVLHPTGQIEIHRKDLDYGAADGGLGAYAHIGIQDSTGGTFSSHFILNHGPGEPYGSLDNESAISIALCTDADSDGYAATSCGGTDCDDSNADVNPGAVEVCDASALDEDCDADTQQTDDNDSDGASPCGSDGTPNTGDEDCDDTRAYMRPGASEVCDGYDNDCNGVADFSDSAGDESDTDTDGYLSCSNFIDQATNDSYVGEQDCDDEKFWRTPGLTQEFCDGYDNDCDGLANFQVAGDITLNENDEDQDGWLSCSSAVFRNYSSSDAILGADDCDDNAEEAYPGAPEACDGVDQDCDWSTSDEYEDTDNDGASPCGTDATANTGAEDCDDTNAALNLTDTDGDEASTCSGDCDDDNATVYSGAVELCDNLDTDCDGTDGSGEGADADGDGVCDGDDVCPEADDLDLLLPWIAFYNSVSSQTWSSALAGFDFDDDGNNDLVLIGNEEIRIISGGVPNPTTETTIDKPSDGSGNWAAAVSAGDFNGDGRDDLVVGDYSYSSTDHTDAGRIELYWGLAAGGVSETFDESLEGQAEDAELGRQLSLESDLDGDGYNEIVATAWSAGASGTDTLRVFRGLSGGPVTVLPYALTYSFPASYFTALSTVPSVDGDGFDDIALGLTSLGTVLVISGGNPLPAHGTNLGTIATEISGPTNENFASYVKGLGDINGDSYGDLAVSSSGLTFDGSVDVFLGAPNGIDTTASYTFFGDTLEGEFGVSVTSGDFDGDGNVDLVFGAKSDGANSSGLVHYYSGESGFVASSTTADADLSLAPGLTGSGNPFEANFGEVVSAMGDVDLDGDEDLLVGAPSYQVTANNSEGQAFIFSLAEYLANNDSDSTPDSCDICDFDSENDADQDGFCSGGTNELGDSADCEDQYAGINPGATEACNGIDDNCDGLPEDEADADGDTEMACSGDCDDNNAAVNTSAAEACGDGIDNDCDSAVDLDDSDCSGDDDDSAGDDDDSGPGDDDDDDSSGDDDDSSDGVGGECPDGEQEDKDGDGFPCVNDCDDESASVYPGAELVCDYFFDTNCDGVFDVEARCDGCACNLDSSEPLPTETLLLLIPFAVLGLRRRHKALSSLS